MELNKEDLKREIEILEKEVFSIGRIIINAINERKNPDESNITDGEKEELKENNAKLKELKAEQKAKNEQLKIYRSIYTNLLKEIKSDGGKNVDPLMQLFEQIKQLGIQSNTPPIQQKQE